MDGDKRGRGERGAKLKVQSLKLKGSSRGEDLIAGDVRGRIPQSAICNLQSKEALSKLGGHGK
jgi:hypothetical protein